MQNSNFQYKFANALSLKLFENVVISCDKTSMPNNDNNEMN